MLILGDTNVLCKVNKKKAKPTKKSAVMERNEKELAENLPQRRKAEITAMQTRNDGMIEVYCKFF